MSFEETIRQIIREEFSSFKMELTKESQDQQNQKYPPLLKVEEVAKILQVSKTRIYELVHQPGFPVIREGRKIRIPTHRLFAWINQQDKSQQAI